jgi:hypothetical protein
MLLTVNNGVFYEFIPMDMLEDVMSAKQNQTPSQNQILGLNQMPSQSHTSCQSQMPGQNQILSLNQVPSLKQIPNLKQIPTLEDVVPGVDYAVVITTCGGLWRYLIGDCVRFTSTTPHRIQITGRTQLCINAFGEELMIANAENALVDACRECDCSVTEFTVGPVFMSAANTKGYHRWAIEFSRQPADLESFALCLDRCLCNCNSDYAAKRSCDATMQRLQIIPLPDGTFMRWMEKRNKLGGQNKVPRLHQTLQFIDELTSLG